VKMLEIRPLCVCEIQLILDLAVSTTSKHLSILRDAELIYDHHEGKWVYYQLNQVSHNIYIKTLLLQIKDWLNDDRIILQDVHKVNTLVQHDLCKL